MGLVVLAVLVAGGRAILVDDLEAAGDDPAVQVLEPVDVGGHERERVGGVALVLGEMEIHATDAVPGGVLVLEP